MHFMSVHVENNQSVYFTEDNHHERASKTHLAPSTGCIRIILNTTSCGYSCDSLTRKAKKFVSNLLLAKIRQQSNIVIAVAALLAQHSYC